MRVDAEAERVAQAHREHGAVRPERVVRRDRAVGVQAEDLPSEAGPVLRQGVVAGLAHREDRPGTLERQQHRLRGVPARTPESDSMSKELKERGFTFVGSTICYAYMQAAGMVNDHLVTCFRHAEVQR